MMTVKINDEIHHFPTSLSVEATLREMNKWVESGIAVAINEEVIPKSKWQEVLLNDQDELLIVTATQGG